MKAPRVGEKKGPVWPEGREGWARQGPYAAECNWSPPGGIRILSPRLTPSPLGGTPPCPTTPHSSEGPASQYPPPSQGPPSPFPKAETPALYWGTRVSALAPFQGTPALPPPKELNLTGETPSISNPFPLLGTSLLLSTEGPESPPPPPSGDRGSSGWRCKRVTCEGCGTG